MVINSRILRTALAGMRQYEVLRSQDFRDTTGVAPLTASQSPGLAISTRSGHLSRIRKTVIPCLMELGFAESEQQSSFPR